MMSNNQLSTFLSDYPLYKPYKLFEAQGPNISVAYPYTIKRSTFSYYCDKEDSITTFHLNYNKFSATELNRVVPGGAVEDDFLDENRILNYSMHFEGTCQSCKKFKIDLLMRIWSDNPIHVSTPRSSTGLGRGDEKNTHQSKIDHATQKPEPVNIFIEKIGINPAKRVEVNKLVCKFLGRESGSLYYKGCKALSENYGIGAFAYFRRILERELIHIVQDLASLPSSNSEKIKMLISEYRETPNIHLVYKNVYELLPKSLQSLGNNPLQFLYQQISEGLHNISEEKCLERASSIEKVLCFVIKKIHEEKSELLEIRNAMKALKDNP